MSKRPLLVYGSRSRVPALNDALVLELDQRLESHAGDRATYETYLTEGDLESIDDEASCFAREWYGDVTNVRGMSIGRTLETPVFFDAAKLLKNVACAMRAIDADIGEIHIGEGAGIVPWAWWAVAESRGVRAIDLPPIKGLAAPRTTKRPERRREFVRSGKPILAVYEGRHTCEAWFAQLRREFDLLPMQPRVSFADLARGFAIFAQRAAHRPEFRFEGIDLRPYWQPRVRRMFLRDLPFSYAKVEAQRRAYVDAGAVGVVAAWHELDGLQAEAAAAAGIPLVALQDSWLPGEHFPAGYRNHVRCDHLMVWGEISARWARGIRGAEIHVIGSPGALAQRERPPRETNTRRRVVLAHQCWGPWSAFHSPLDTNDTWNVLADAARAVPDVDFAGKIHPLADDDLHEGRGRSREIIEWVRARNLPNLEVVPLDASLDAILAESDLLVTYYSLVGLEALVQQIPVAMLNVTSKRDLFPELVELGGSAAVRSAGDLAALARAGAPVDRDRVQQLLRAVFAEEPRDLAPLVAGIVAR